MIKNKIIKMLYLIAAVCICILALGCSANKEANNQEQTSVNENAVETTETALDSKLVKTKDVKRTNGNLNFNADKGNEWFYNENGINVKVCTEVSTSYLTYESSAGSVDRVVIPTIIGANVNSICTYEVDINGDGRNDLLFTYHTDSDVNTRCNKRALCYDFESQELLNFFDESGVHTKFTNEQKADIISLITTHYFNELKSFMGLSNSELYTFQTNYFLTTVVTYNDKEYIQVDFQIDGAEKSNYGKNPYYFRGLFEYIDETLKITNISFGTIAELYNIK